MTPNKDKTYKQERKTDIMTSYKVVNITNKEDETNVKLFEDYQEALAEWQSREQDLKNKVLAEDVKEVALKELRDTGICTRRQAYKPKTIEEIKDIARNIYAVSIGADFYNITDVNFEGSHLDEEEQNAFVVSVIDDEYADYEYIKFEELANKTNVAFYKLVTV